MRGRTMHSVSWLGSLWVEPIKTAINKNKNIDAAKNLLKIEYDSIFKEYLKKTRAYAIDMETATLFNVGFHNKIPTGALLLTSDSPMTPEGVKTLKKDEINSFESNIFCLISKNASS